MYRFAIATLVLLFATPCLAAETMSVTKDATGVTIQSVSKHVNLRLKGDWKNEAYTPPKPRDAVQISAWTYRQSGKNLAFCLVVDHQFDARTPKYPTFQAAQTALPGLLAQSRLYATATWAEFYDISLEDDIVPGEMKTVPVGAKAKANQVDFEAVVGPTTSYVRSLLIMETGGRLFSFSCEVEEDQKGWLDGMSRMVSTNG